jgi:hypothetical protein
MRTHYTYWFEDGQIWRVSHGGIYRVKWDILPVDRLFAARLLAQHTESAKSSDYFAKRAAELRDEMVEAIQKFDAFHYHQQPEGQGTGKENTNGYAIQESGTQEGQAAA